jgi:outer membrane receptor protein involved in Fe transport
VSTQRQRELNQQEISFFFKDDWKIRRNLTLNLGVRWDYYGVPWVSNGLTAIPDGGVTHSLAIPDVV